MDEFAPFSLTGAQLADLTVHHDVEVDLFTGAAAVSVPLPTMTGRDGFGPTLALCYKPDAGNSVFGLGWGLTGATPVTRGTRRLPRYDDTDRYGYGDRDLVPALEKVAGVWRRRTATRGAYAVQFFRARDDHAQTRVERWVHTGTGAVHWQAREPDNTLTVLGRADAGPARIADPEAPDRIYAWLPEWQFDGYGNVIRYEYRAEDTTGVDRTAAAERAHLRGTGWPQRHLSRIRYGNTVPFGPDDPEPATNTWLFQVVFDYGDHPGSGPEPDAPWPARPDPFSTYRPGFDLRTHRLCRRVLMFHDFPDLGPGPTLVTGVALGYDEDAAGSTLVSVTQTGHRRDGGTVTARALPPLWLTYSPVVPVPEFTPVAAGSLENAPHGLAERGSRWLDLHGDGLPGLLTETPDAWYYKPNDGTGRLGAQVRLAARPTGAGTATALGDYDRDGNTDLVSATGRWAGAAYLDRGTGRWSGYRPFTATPRMEALGPLIQWLDVDGDGLAEPLVAGATGVHWYPALGRDGFGPPDAAPRAAGPDAPPALAAAPERGLFLADLNGDGLADLVHVSNGRIRYWPQLGHGRFGAVVEMDGAPLFPDGEFDPARLRFVDLDGSGTADLIHLGRAELRCWTNASGNRWVAQPARTGLPYLDRLAAVDVLDMLGAGRPCLVWSSPLPGQSTPVRYAPLAGPLPPRLLTAVANSVGGEVRLTYESSVRDYVRDRDAGRDWYTRLPHHPMVVRIRELVDHVTGGRSVTRYEYHDGYFDGAERTFRGFGLVDRYDADTGADDTSVACVRTWLHTGAPDWYRSLADGYRLDAGLVTIPPATVEELGSFGPGEYEDGLRCLAGRPVRVETYATDPAGDRAAHPFHVTQTRYTVRRLQPSAGARPGAYHCHVLETVGHVYEGQPLDPRVTQQVATGVDRYGAVVRIAELGYPRRPGGSAIAAQHQGVGTARWHRWVHLDTVDRYELNIPAETVEFELTAPAGPALWSAEVVAAELAGPLAHVLDAHEEFPAGAGTRARLLGWRRHRYWSTDRTGPLPVGQVGAPTLAHHDEEACFTGAQARAALDTRVSDAILTGLGYLSRDGYWWQPGPVVEYTAADRFSRAVRMRRADGALTSLGYDPYHLMPVERVDAVQNRSTTHIDYYECLPGRVTDPNGAVHEVRRDPLGVVVASGRYATVLEPDGVTTHPWGDEPLPATVSAPAAAALLADPVAALAAAGLTGAGEVCGYDLDAWATAGAAPHLVRVTREQHAHDGAGGGGPGDGAGGDGAGGGAWSAGGGAVPPRLSVSYVDGYGRLAQERRKVGPGRWLVSGAVVYDAKQQPVREYEPYFGTTHEFETDQQVARVGVARRSRYDAVGRPARVDEPDGSYLAWTHLPWESRVADRNDTVQDSVYRVSREALPDADPAKQALRAAQAHAGTPQVTHLDPRGRAVRRVESTGTADRVMELVLDARGEAREVVDPRGLTSLRYMRDLRGRMLYRHSVDAGAAWCLPDAYDRPVHRWDGRGNHTRTSYDALDRPTVVRVDDGTGPPRVTEELRYGEHPAVDHATSRQARGRLVRHRDQAGVRTVHRYDPAGMELHSERHLCASYTDDPDWAQPATVVLEPTGYVTRTGYDALDRVVRRALADGTVRTITYGPEGGVAGVHLAWPDGTRPGLTVLTSAEYNARGQRTRAVLGNGVTLSHSYDPETFRPDGITAVRPDGVTVQDLAYTYDPTGNVTHAVDRAQVLRGSTVSPHSDYRYDALYRLTSATGRVHQALLEHDYRAEGAAPGSFRGSRHLSLNNGQAVERYTQQYGYDLADNLTRVVHQGPHGWTTDIWTSASSNRALPMRDPGGATVASPESRFDAVGNTRWLPHLAALDWGYHGRLTRAVVVDRSAGVLPDDAEYYRYGADGLRIRKVSQRVVDAQTGSIEATDQVYLDGCEIYRIGRDGRTVLERRTSRVDDGERHLAVVHRWDQDPQRRQTDTAPTAGAPVVRTRYQLGDPLGSARLELDEAGGVLSYEEYFPYGGSAFIAGDSQRDAAVKDQRFRGAERSDLTGLYYGGHRYYAPWLGRWLSPDPLGTTDALNEYEFCLDNPVTYHDPDGLRSVPRTAQVAAKPAAQQTPSRGNVETQLRKAVAQLPPAQRAEAERQIRQQGPALRTATGFQLETAEVEVAGKVVSRGVRLTLQFGPAPPDPGGPSGETGARVAPPPARRPTPRPPAAPPPAGPPPATSSAAPPSDAADQSAAGTGTPPPDAPPPQDPNEVSATPPPQSADPPEDRAEQAPPEPEGAEGEPEEAEGEPEDPRLSAGDPAEYEEPDVTDPADLDDLPPVPVLAGSVESGWTLPPEPEELSDEPQRPRALSEDFIDGFLDEAKEIVVDDLLGRLADGILGPTGLILASPMLVESVVTTYKEYGRGFSGTMGVVNMFNPLSIAMRAGYESDQEAENALYLQSLGEHEGAAAHAKASGRAYANAVKGSIELGMLAGGLAMAAGKKKPSPNKPPPQEGGAYGPMRYRATGQGVNCNHMPQAARGFTSKAEGGAIKMIVDDHKLTRTYKWKGKILKYLERKLPFRQTLAADIKDVRRNSQQQYGTTRGYNKAMQQMLDYYRDHPQRSIRNRMKVPGERVLPVSERNFLKQFFPHINLNFGPMPGPPP